MNKKKTLYTSLTALALASFSVTSFADEVNTATEEVSVTLADEAVVGTTVLEASSEVAATETVAEEESATATATATNLYEETAVAEKPVVDYTYFAGEWEHKDSGIYEGTVSADGSVSLPLLADGNYVPKGGTYQEFGLDADGKIALIDVIADQDMIIASGWKFTRKGAAQTEETATEPATADIDYAYFAGEWEHKASGYEGTVSADGSVTLPTLAKGNYVPKGGTYQEFGLDADGKIALIDVIADQDMIIASGWKFTRKGATQTKETATEPSTEEIDYAYFAGQWEAPEVAYLPEITADGTISWEPMKAGHFVKKGEYIGNEVIAEEDQIYVDNIKFTRVPAGPDHAYFADEWVDVTTGDSFTHAADGTNSQDYFDPETGHKAVTPRTYVKKGETYRQSGADHIAEEDLIITPSGRFTRKSSTQTEEVVEPEDVDTHAETRYDLLTKIDKSGLSDAQKSALAEKVAFAETAKELASIEDEFKAQNGAGGVAAASQGQESHKTTPKASEQAAAPTYSRVARAQAEKANAEKKLPSTGETDSVLALIGLGLASLGLLGRKRRYN